MSPPELPLIRFIDNYSRGEMSPKRIRKLGLGYFRSCLREAVKFWRKLPDKPRIAGVLISYDEMYEVMDITIEFVDHFSVSWWAGRGYISYLKPRAAKNRIVENIDEALSDLRGSMDTEPAVDYPA